MISCTSAPFTSCLAQLLLPPVGQTSGFLSVTNSVSVNAGPCSKIKDVGAVGTAYRYFIVT